jgi:class 3 adenylate cyclase
LKRITYVSRQAESLTSRDIGELGRTARANNRRDGITGFLLYTSGIFFQVIEGEDEAIDLLFGKIKRDSRHEDILCLRAETGLAERNFPTWSMKVINLDEKTGELGLPLKVLIRSLSESQNTLGKYTQPKILDFISRGINPLEVPSRHSRKTILFSDMVGFSFFAAALPAEESVALINEYLAVCTRVVFDHGGEVAKFLGDGMMASFEDGGVPESLRCALDMLSELERLRRMAAPGSPLKFLYTGIGISAGEVIEGNIGTNHKREFTVIGDCVNKAAYLQDLTRSLPRSLAFSSNVADEVPPEMPLIELGSYTLKTGRPSTPIYSIDVPLTVKPDSYSETAGLVRHGAASLVEEVPGVTEPEKLNLKPASAPAQRPQ